MIDKFQPDDFFYTLSTPDGQSLRCDPSPDGWDEYKTTWTRDKYIGVGRKSVVSLRFYKESCKMLKELYMRDGVDAKCVLTIEITDRATYTQSVDFVADLNFSEFEYVSDLKVEYAEVQVLESGVHSYISAREKNKYEVPFNRTMRIPEGASSLQSATWNSFILFDSGATERLEMSANLQNSDVSSNHTAFYSGTDISELLADHKSIKIAEYNSFEGQNDAMNYRFSVRGFLENTAVNDFIPYILRLALRVQRPSGSQYYYMIETPDPISTRLDLDYEFTIPVGSNDPGDLVEEIFLDFEYGVVNNQHQAFNAELTIEHTSITEALLGPFDIRVISVYDAARFLLNKIAEPLTIDFQSNHLQIGALKDVYLTSGEGVRNLDNAVLKTSFTDLYDNIERRFGASLTVKGLSVKLEAYTDAFKQDLILNLGQVRDLVRKPAVDLMFNTVKLGCKDTEYRQTNGRYEFNGNTEQLFPLLTIDDTYEGVGTYRTDSLGITDVRLEFEKNSSKSSNQDNDVFMIHGVVQGNILIPFYNVNVIADFNQQSRPGIFNHYLTPKRCFLRKRAQWASVLCRTTGLVDFTFSSKTDANLVSQLLGQYLEDSPVFEKSQERIDLTKNAWFPDLLTVTTVLPRNLVQQINDKENGLVQFEYAGEVLRGFLWNVGAEPSRNTPQEITLLEYRPGINKEIPPDGSCEIYTVPESVTISGTNFVDIRVESNNKDGVIPYIIEEIPDWLGYEETSPGTLRLRPKNVAINDESGVVVLKQTGLCDRTARIGVVQKAIRPVGKWSGLYSITTPSGPARPNPDTLYTINLLESNTAIPGDPVWRVYSGQKNTIEKYYYGAVDKSNKLFIADVSNVTAPVPIRVNWSGTLLVKERDESTPGANRIIEVMATFFDQSIWDQGFGADTLARQAAREVVNAPVVGQPYALSSSGSFILTPATIRPPGGDPYEAPGQWYLQFYAGTVNGSGYRQVIEFRLDNLEIIL